MHCPASRRASVCGILTARAWKLTSDCWCERNVPIQSEDLLFDGRHNSRDIIYMNLSLGEDDVWHYDILHELTRRTRYIRSSNSAPRSNFQTELAEIAENVAK